MPATYAAAKKEACVIAGTKVTDFTNKQVATAAVWSLQVFGCFCIGEAIARRDFRGYPVFLPKDNHH